jgi:hypothetical protein
MHADDVKAESGMAVTGTDLIVDFDELQMLPARRADYLS